MQVLIFYLVKPVSFPSIIQQFNDLFNNQYFITNTRPPRNQFVIGSSNLYIVAPDAIADVKGLCKKYLSQSNKAKGKRDNRTIKTRPSNSRVY
jgi:hypothetical protein